MLLIDKKPFQVTKKDIEAEFPNLPKFPLRFDLNPAKYRHFDKDNSRWIYPASSPILSRFTYSDSDGQHEVIYYENSVVTQKDKTDYLPYYAADFFNGNPCFVSANQPDKAWFMLHYPKTDVSPYLLDNDKKSEDWDIVLEDKKKSADEKNQKVKQRNRAYELLDEMSITKQRDVLKAIAPLAENVDGMGDGEVYSFLSDEIEKGASGNFKSGAEKFIYYTDGSHTEIKALIRTALDNKILFYSHSEKGIYWASATGERIFSVNPTKDYIDQAYVWFKDNPRILNALEKAVADLKGEPTGYIAKAESTQATIGKSPERLALEAEATKLGINKMTFLKAKDETLRKKIEEAKLQTV